MLSGVHCYRGIAALLVLLFHGAEITSERSKNELNFGLFEVGHCGVPFFFVLSGFIIFYIHKEDIGNRKVIPHYLKKRFLRIYPIYWFVLSVLQIIWIFYSDFGYPFRREVVPTALSFALIHHDTFPNLGVAWTLEFEVLFYFVFSLIILNKNAWWLFIAWLGGCFLTSTELIPIDSDYILSMYNVLFGIGILAAAAVKTKITIPQYYKVLAFYFGNIFFICSMIFDYYEILHSPSTKYAYGIAAALILFGACHFSIDAFFSRRKWLLFLGSASYSIYLIHRPVLTACSRVFEKLLPSTNASDWLAFSVSSMIALVVGIMLHIIVEKPLQRFLALSFETKKSVTL